MNELVASQEPPFYKRWYQLLHWKIQVWKDRNKPTDLQLHALREFKALGYTPLNQPQEDGPNKWVQENVLELLKVFSTQGHSGFSAPYCINAFRKLASWEPLCPLTGEADEWNEVSDDLWQNNRCSRVFKRADNKPYDIEGRIFQEPSGACYTSRDSRVYIEFPYTPKSEYVNAPLGTP